MSLKITSGSLTVDIKRDIDLEIVYEYISLDKFILGVKFGDLRRGKTSLTNTFYNQLTLCCCFNKIITVKIFKNGKINISGITSKNQGIEIIMYIIDKIVAIKGEKEVLLTCLQGVLYDKKDLEYANSDLSCISSTRSKPSYPVKIYSINDRGYVSIIGCKRKDTFYLNGKKVIMYKNYFLLKEDSNTFKVYSLKGDYLGTVVDTFVQRYKTNTPNRYKHVVISEFEIHFLSESGHYKGKRIFNFDNINTVLSPILLNKNFLYKRKLEAVKDNNIEKIEIVSCFLNYQDNIGKALNKKRLQEIFNEKGWKSVYQLIGKVSKVTLIMDKYDNMEINPIKIIFYSTGKVTVHSSSEEKLTCKIYSKILDIIKNNNDIFYNENVVVVNKDINITDIM